MTSSELQTRLHDVWSPFEAPSRLRKSRLADPETQLLVILQAVNAGGKDGVIKEIISVLGDANLRVERFGHPEPSDADREPLSRARRRAPRPGEIVFFNRSYYEVPLHQFQTGASDLAGLFGPIVEFERELVEAGISLVKLFLHIDKSEQRHRLKARELSPELRHLHNPNDYEDQERWEELILAYGMAIARTHTLASPWFVIPSNERGFRNAAVEQILIEHLSLA